ncbi:putative glycosidase crf1 [Hyphodiscus hymeniophilus]|uniref:Crh-like protein n=1 Tax=Hyphodiscus hymeniophilus TaxID=353542 RepID=A0A9P6VKR2_9HELO|nr:putative glycosidase crf1 [Hyphodiscus hymeniophilus]
MHASALAAAALLFASLRVVNAQTFTDCNPLEKTTCPSDPALGSTLTTDWTTGASDDWTLANGTTLKYGSKGAEFTIDKATDAPTIGSNKYIFFGKVDAVILSAPGTGIVSSFILESDDLDEIDWEWLGSTDTSVESNFFGKGNTTDYNRAAYHDVADPIATWHTYTVDWTSSYIKWSIDGNLVRTLNYDDALALEGKNFPQTPMKVKMGNWVGCADAAANEPSSPTYGTCQWAGGPADFSSAPFTMYVQKVTIQDYSCGSEYSYGDTSGSFGSIKVSGSCNGKAVSSSSSAASSVTSSVSSSSSGAVFVQTSNSTQTQSSESSAATTAVSTTKSSTAAASTISTATKSSASSTTSNSPPTVSSNSATTVLPKKSKYGAMDVAVIVLGLTLGYFVM